jgi:hypothetical protein
VKSTIARPGVPCPQPRTTGYTIAANALDGLGLNPREEQFVRRILKFRWTPESVVFVRIAVLAAEMHCHRRTVERTIDSLAKKGLLTVEARYRDDGGQAANRYILSSVLTTAIMSDGQCQDVAAIRHECRTPTTSTPQQKTDTRNKTQRTGETGIDEADQTPSSYGVGRQGTVPAR